MSQSVNLYQISKDDFEEFSKNYKTVNLEFTDDNSSVFDQNFEGLNFLLSSFFGEQLPEPFEKLFYPQEFIGDEIDYNQFDLDDIVNFPESNAVYFIDPKNILEINETLNKIDNDKILSFYNALNFNVNDVYPSVWHNDESEDQAFNKRHLEEGLELLRKTFSKASNSKSYILLFNE